MWLLTLGARNLLRSPKRVGLSLVSVVAGVGLFILGDGMANGLTENVIRAEIDSVSAHLTVRPEGYDADNRSRPLDGAFTLSDGAIDLLDAQAEHWTRRLMFSPEGIANGDGLPLRGIAFDPVHDEAVFPRDTWVVDGVIPSGADDGALLSKTAADLLGLSVGDVFTLRSRTLDGAMNAIHVPLAGTLSAGNPILDVNTVFVPWEQADTLLLHHGRTTHAHARLARRNNAPELAAALQPELDGQETRTWEQSTDELASQMETRKIMFRILSFALLGMAATGIANTILMAAYERVREVGTFRAMGMTRSQVTQLFLVEGAVLGIVGGLIGSVLAGTACYYWSVNGIDMGPLMEAGGDAKQGIAFSTMLYLDFSFTTVLTGFVIGLIVSIIASVYPARAASAQSPADAVRA